MPDDWTAEIIEALPEWLRAELGLAPPGPEAPPVPPPNLPGYAPLPGIGGGFQPPEPAPEPAPSSAPARRAPSWAPFVIAGAGAATLVGVIAAWRRA